MNEWIECNLPWNFQADLPPVTEFPDMDAKVITKFGKTLFS